MKTENTSASTIPASVGILTFNNESTIRRALESVRDFDDIVICDGGSTDSTLEIAREFGAHCIAQDAQYKNPDGSLSNYGGVRNQCLDAAQHDWFLYIDSDEAISPGLREEIRNAVAHPDGSLVYKVPIGIKMDGNYLKYSSNYPGYQHRFFNKQSGARFIKAVHERISFNKEETPSGVFTHPWYVHTTRAYWNHYLKETGSYRPIEIREACNKPFSPRDYFIYGVLWHLRASAVIVIKATRNYVFHGFKNAVPVRGELGRALAPLLNIWGVTSCRIRKLFSSKQP